MRYDRIDQKSKRWNVFFLRVGSWSKEISAFKDKSQNKQSNYIIFFYSNDLCAWQGQVLSLWSSRLIEMWLYHLNIRE